MMPPTRTSPVVDLVTPMGPMSHSVRLNPAEHIGIELKGFGAVQRVKLVPAYVTDFTPAGTGSGLCPLIPANITNTTPCGSATHRKTSDAGNVIGSPKDRTASRFDSRRIGVYVRDSYIP